MASARLDVDRDDPAVGDHVLLVRRNVAYQTLTGHHALRNPALDDVANAVPCATHAVLRHSVWILDGTTH